MYVISRCLLGYNCKYDGGNNKNDDVIEFCKTHDYVTICPETAGGLESPRPPAEIKPVGADCFKVLDRDGKDVTRAFDEGAEISLRSVLLEIMQRRGNDKIEGAILKANSPSCGTGIIYDGTFTGTRTAGNGIFTDKLIYSCLEERKKAGTTGMFCVFANDFTVVDENNVSKLTDK